MAYKDKEKKKEYDRQYRITNKDKISKKLSEIYYLNLEQRLEYSKNYRDKNKDKIIVQQRKRYKNNGYYKEYNINYEKNRIKTDPLFKLSKNIKCLIRNSIKKGKGGKRTEEILGCSFEEFKLHIESQFETWMNCNNYGSVNGNPPTYLNQCWDLDHIIPLSSATTEEEVFKLNHYTNFQPLCAYTNRWIKKDNIDFKKE